MYRPDRINPNGGFGVDVLAPINEYPAHSQTLSHFRNNEARVLASQFLSDGASKCSGAGIRNRCVQGDVDLDAFRSRHFREGLKMLVCQLWLEQERNGGAIEGGRAFARIEVENYARWLLEIFDSMKKWVELDRGNAGAPD